MNDEDALLAEALRQSAQEYNMQHQSNQNIDKLLEEENYYDNGFNINQKDFYLDKTKDNFSEAEIGSNANLNDFLEEDIEPFSHNQANNNQDMQEETNLPNTPIDNQFQQQGFQPDNFENYLQSNIENGEINGFHNEQFDEREKILIPESRLKET